MKWWSSYNHIWCRNAPIITLKCRYLFVWSVETSSDGMLSRTDDIWWSVHKAWWVQYNEFQIESQLDSQGNNSITIWLILLFTDNFVDWINCMKMVNTSTNMVEKRKNLDIWGNGVKTRGMLECTIRWMRIKQGNQRTRMFPHWGNWVDRMKWKWWILPQEGS